MTKLYCLFTFALLLMSIGSIAQPGKYKNVWTSAPKHTPNDASIDAPLMGNGDLLATVGFDKGLLRYYIGKNDFWRLQSKADHLSGPRVAGYLNFKIAEFENADFAAEQRLDNGVTTINLTKADQRLTIRSWVSAMDDLMFIDLTTYDRPIDIALNLSAPENKMAKVDLGKTKGIYHLTRAFVDDVDTATEVAIAYRSLYTNSDIIKLQPGQPVIIVVAAQSKFKSKDPLQYVLNRLVNANTNTRGNAIDRHNKWWNDYWQKSSVTVGDTVLMKAYYQGLYTMGACSRDKRFPPGLFGWVVGDNPSWNGDYHMNYNFFAPFYGLYSANRLQQAETQEQPLLDFMPRGRYYAQKATGTRGVLYPVGIGPIGTEVTRDFPYGTDNYTLEHDVEYGGLFYQQRSNAVFGTVNMAQHWRMTYDPAYGKRIYPYVLGVIDFWEDFLKYENGRYVIYKDAATEKSGYNKNTLMSLALVKNALDLMLDLSVNLNRDAARRAKWKHMLDHLSEFPTTTRNGRTTFRGAEEDKDDKPVYGASYSGIYPANSVTLDSSARMISIGKNSVAAIPRWQHHNSTNSYYMSTIRVAYDSLVILNKLHEYALTTYPNGFQLDNPHGIENACTVANALNEMLCMSVGNNIRLFRVWPKDRDASFKNIRAWGAFLVSADLVGGKVSGVKIFSERGRPCTVTNPWPGQTVRLIRKGKKPQSLSGQKISFNTAVNETVELRP